MAITQALEFDQTPNKLLFEIGEQAREQAMMRMKLQQDNMQRQNQVLQQINPATLYPKFEKEVVDQSIGGITSNVAEYLKRNPNASYVDLQNEINKSLSDLASWSARVKSVKESITQGVNSISNDDPYDKGRVRALAIDKALYKTDELGRKVLKGAEEIEVDQDYISLAKQDERTVDAEKGQDLALKVVNNAPTLEIDDVRTIETPDGRKTTKTGTVTKLPFYLQNKDGKVTIRQDDNGYIDETVYSTFYTNPATRAWIDSKAKDNMRAIGVPDTPEGNEYFKRAFLTNWLETQAKGSIKPVNDVTYNIPQRSNVTVNLGGAVGGGKGFIDAFESLDELATKKFNEGKYLQLNLTKDPDLIVDYAKDASGIQKLNQSNLKIIKSKDGNTGIYAAEDIIGAEKTVDFPFGKPVYKKNQLIAIVDRDKFNIMANDKLGTDTKKRSASSKESKKMVYNEKTGKFE